MNFTVTVVTPEIIIAALATLVFGFLLILAAFRLRSKEKVVYHLLLYMGLGFLLSLLTLADLIHLTLLVHNFYLLLMGLTELAMILAFGALSLNFLKKSRRGLIAYWIVAGIILVAWSIVSFNPLNWGIMISAYLGQIGWYPIYPLAITIAATGWSFALAIPFIALLFEFRKRHPTQYLNKLRYWLIAIILLTAAGVVSFNFPALFGISLSLLTAGSVLAGYTVLSYHTPDLALLFGRALRYVIVMLVLFAAILFGLAAIIVISNTPTVYSDAMVIWIAIFIALFLANILPPLWKLGEQILTRIIFGRFRRDQKQVITRYSRSISSVLDMNRLGDTIINLMIETLGIERGIVFINERGSGNVSLRPLSAIGLNDLKPGHFTSESPFIIRLRQEDKVLSQYDIDVLPEFRAMTDTEKKWLAGLGMELYVPIKRDRELIGLLAFGPQAQGASYYDEDIDLMTALADQAALAIDSARLFEQLSMINQEVGLLTNQLAGLDQDKSDFLSIASHELRTPLTHIHGYSRMLLDLTEEELQDPNYVKTIIDGVAKGSERMKDVVDLMFDVTEAHAGEFNLFIGPVVVDEVIEQAINPYLPAFDERRIALHKDLNDLPTIEADGTRLMQAFENLISNAIKYTPNGGMVSIEGRATVIDNIGQAVEIVVSDTGIGIEPEHQERIFEKFFRVDDTAHHSTGKTKFKGAGPGLGLPLVKGIAQAHGGKVWVESLGQDEVNCPGSKFFFVLPLHSKPSARRPQSEIETRHWHGDDDDDDKPQSKN